jgi:hypothetical protein
MSLKNKYSTEVRRELSLFPVWVPGDKIEAGDIGTLEKGVFEKQTSLGKLFPDLAFEVKETPLTNPFRYISKDCVAGALSASTAIPTGSTPVDVDGTIEIRFGSNGGLVFAANGITQYAIDDLHDVRTFLEEQRSSWPRGYALVTAVHKAERFTVIISDGAEVTATIQGKASVLHQLNLADAGVSVTSVSNSGYQTQGQGAVTLRAYGFNLFGYGSTLAKLESADFEDTDSPVDPFLEISARDPNFD